MDWGKLNICLCSVLLLWFSLVLGGDGFNITTFLWKHPEFTTFNSLLTATNVAGEINNRSSLTILALSNAQMAQFISNFHGNLPTQEVSDVLRYHVLLEYWGWDRLQRKNPYGTLVTTLYQTTGRAPNNTGAVNLTSVDGQVRIGMPVPGETGYNATISGIVDDFPYVINIARVSNMIFPFGFDLSGSPPPSPVGINVTDVLVKAQNFNFLVSLMEASGVVSDFQSEEAGAGITIFAPTDDAFSALKPDTLQGLSADKKALILKYHVLLTYYPLGTLQTIMNPVQPTLATQAMGASSYTLNITSIQGKVAVSTGVVHAPVTETVIDEKPLAIFAVTKVLLPREIFAPKIAPSPAPAPAPASTMSPLLPPELSPCRSPASAPSPSSGPVQSPLNPSSPSVSPISAPYAAPSYSPIPDILPPISSPNPNILPPIPSPTSDILSPTPSPIPVIVSPISSPIPVAVSPTPSPIPVIGSPAASPISVIVSPAPSVLAASPVLSPYVSVANPPTPAGVEMSPPLTPSESPSPSPFGAGVGKISSGAPGRCVFRVMGFGGVLAVVLLLGKL